MRTALFFVLMASFVFAAALSDSLSAAPTAEQLQKLKSADAALQQAAAKFTARKFKEAGESVKQAQALVAELDDTRELDRQLAPIIARLRRAHALLEIEGVSLPALDLPTGERVGQATVKTPAKKSPRSAGDPAEASPPATRPATGGEAMLFARDVAPVLVENCFECHGPGRRNGGQFSLNTFAGLLRGGQSGVAINPGKPADSLIVKKLRGTAGARMPLDRDPLAESDIAKIEQWIAAGAKYDATDAGQSLEGIAAITRARASTHEELAAERALLAQKNWRLAIPDEQPDTTETKNFLLVGNIGEAPLKSLGELAEQQAATVAKMLRAPDDQPLVKGRITLFAFKGRVDYSEWRNVDGREVPAAWRAHWRFDVADAYACLVPPGASEYSLAPLVAQQVASVYIASLGDVPAWFPDGVGHVTASRVDPRDARVRDWDGQLSRALSSRWSADDFLAGKLPPEQQRLLNYAFVKALAANGQKYQGLLAHLRQSADFEPAFARAFGGTPQSVIAASTGRAVAPRPPVRR